MLLDNYSKFQRLNEQRSENLRVNIINAHATSKLHEYKVLIFFASWYRNTQSFLAPDTASLCYAR